jgi:hypothetical protein
MNDITKQHSNLSLFFPIDIEQHVIIELSLKNETTMKWFLTLAPPRFSRCPTPKHFLIAASEPTMASLSKISAIKRDEKDVEQAKIDKNLDRTLLTAGFINITYRDLKNCINPLTTTKKNIKYHVNDQAPIYRL